MSALFLGGNLNKKRFLFAMERFTGFFGPFDATKSTNHAKKKYNIAKMANSLDILNINLYIFPSISAKVF